MAEIKPGGVVHIELSSSDTSSTRKFLESVFGWKFKQAMAGPEMEYWTFEAGSGPGGGLMATMEGRPPGTLNYILVESVDAAVKKIRAHGGKILMEKQEIPQVGWMAVFEVPGGLTQAVFEPAPGR